MKILFFVFRDTINYLEEDKDVGYLYTSIKSNLKNMEIKVSFQDDKCEKEIIKMILDFSPDILFVDFVPASYQLMKNVLGQVRYYNSFIKVVLYGTEATASAEVIMANNYAIDVVMLGEAEKTIVDLTHRLINHLSLSDCCGIYYRNNSVIVKNKNRDLLFDLDELGFPERSFYKDNIQFRINTSRGCRGCCTFCDLDPMKNFNKHSPVRSRSIEHILEEVRLIIQKYNKRYIFFSDCSFEGANDQIGWLNRLLSGIRSFEKKFRFFFHTRADLITPASVVLLKELVREGLDVVYVGIESGNSQDLKLFNKISDINGNETAIKLLKEYDIPYEYGFIMFHPYSTLEGIENNLNFLEKNRMPISIERLSRKLWMNNGTPIVNKIKRDRLLDDSNDKEIITNVVGYNFIDQKVKALSDFFERINRITTNHSDLYIKSRSVYQNALYSSTIDRRDLLNYKHALDIFIHSCSEISYAVFHRCIQKIRNQVDLDETDFNSCVQQLSEIDAKAQELDKQRYPIIIKLCRRGEWFQR